MHRDSNIWLLGLLLSGAISIPTFAQQVPTLSEDAGCTRWIGKYRQSKGRHQLEISCEVENLISFQIAPIHAPNDLLAQFLAETNKNTARSVQAHPDPNCKIVLIHSKAGITVIDHCQGDGQLDGLYVAVSNHGAP